ncbi:MAG: hypothetical protein QM831_41705 [Kofleriaceae bacterium]
MIAEEWTEQFAPASLAAATKGLVPHFPLVLARAGRKTAAIAWAGAPADLRTRAIARARLSLVIPELRASAWETAVAAPRGTVLEAMTYLGYDPERDGAVHFASPVAEPRIDLVDFVHYATALWAQPNDDELRRFAMEHHGANLLLDAAATHAGLARKMPHHPPPTELDLRIVAAALREPEALVELRASAESFSNPTLVVIERLLELGGNTVALRLAGDNLTLGAIIAWTIADRDAMAKLDRAAAAQRATDGFDETPLLVDAIYASIQPDAAERLDELAHAHLVAILGDDQAAFLGFLDGAPPIYPGVSARELERAERDIEQNRATPQAIWTVLRASAHLSSHGERASARNALEHIDGVPLTTLLRDRTSLSLAITAWARIGDIEKVANLTDAILPSIDGRALGAYARAVAATNKVRAAQILAKGLVTERRRLTRHDLVELVPAIVAIEPDAGSVLRHGWRIAEDHLATLHSI